MEIPRKLRCMSIDIGRVNFAVYVEEWLVGDLHDIKKRNRVKSFVRNTHPDACSTRSLVETAGRCVFIDVQNFTSRKNQPYDDDVRRNILAYFQNHDALLDSVDVFLIEKQYYNPMRKGKSNIDAMMTGEFVYCALFSRIREGQVLMYFPSRFKTELWGAEKMTKPQRKAWSAREAVRILTRRGDDTHLSEIKNKGIKKDDMADCMLMCLTFILHHYLSV